MDPTTIATLFPFLNDDQKSQAADIMKAAEGLQAELAKMQNADLRAMHQRSLSQMVLQTIQTLGQ